MIEHVAVSRRLSLSDLEVFAWVSRDRSDRGLEVLPGLTSCDDVACASRALQEDRRSVRRLRAVGRSPEDYVAIGWTFMVAMYPDDFPIGKGPIVEDNIRFVKQHKARVEALFPEK